MVVVGDFLSGLYLWHMLGMGLLCTLVFIWALGYYGRSLWFRPPTHLVLGIPLYITVSSPYSPCASPIASASGGHSVLHVNTCPIDFLLFQATAPILSI